MLQIETNRLNINEQIKLTKPGGHNWLNWQSHHCFVLLCIQKKKKLYRNIKKIMVMIFLINHWSSLDLLLRRNDITSDTDFLNNSNFPLSLSNKLNLQLALLQKQTNVTQRFWLKWHIAIITSVHSELSPTLWVIGC